MSKLQAKLIMLEAEDRQPFSDANKFLTTIERDHGAEAAEIAALHLMTVGVEYLIMQRGAAGMLDEFMSSVAIGTALRREMLFSKLERWRSKIPAAPRG
ncbi:MAG TPA: hypothetical protein VGJ20_41075 [Xanthobacteraceae bacterium]